MAAATEPSARSPRAAARGLPSPWAHVVRGEPDPSSTSSAAPPPPEPSDRSRPDPAEAAPGSSEGGEQGGSGNAGGGRGRKLAWNRPSNGSAEAGPVMGAVSWPALSECTRASPKSSSSDPLKALPDGSASAPPGPVIAPPPSKPSANSPNPNSSTNHAPTIRQKSMKRGGGSGSSAPANGGLTLSSQPSPETPHAMLDKHSGSEPSPKNNTTSNNWDHSSRGSGFLPQDHTGGDHHRGYSGNRRGNNGGGNYGNRRDQGRGGGGYEWNQPRGFTGRDVRMQPPPPRGVHRPFIGPPPPTSAPFIGPPPPPVPPYMNPMGFPDMSSPVFYMPAPPEPPRGMPFVPAVPPVVLVTPPDHRAMLVKQIDYYFSSENLCKDIYLRQKMDDQGWVPISLIASFNRVKQLTNNIQYILDAVRASEVVEVQGDKLRRRNDWMNWVLPPSPNQYGAPGMQSPTISNYDGLAAHIQSVGLEDGTTNHSITTELTRHEVVLNRSVSGNFINQSQGNDLNGEWRGSAMGHRESGQVNAGRSLSRSDTL